MKKNEMEAIKKCPLFSPADDSIISELLEKGSYEKVCFSKGEEIFSPKAYRKAIAVILKGSALVSKHTEKGSLYMSTLKAGNVFGMSGIFYEGDSFPTTVTAKENLRVLFITKEQLISLFSAYPVILGSFLGILSNKIHFLNEKIDSISAPDAVSALKSYLTDTAQKLGKSTFSLPVSCQTLSSLLGIGRTSLYRAFDELGAEGFLTKDGKVITLLERTENL